MHPLAILNTSIITTDGTYHMQTIDLDTARQLAVVARARRPDPQTGVGPFCHARITLSDDVPP